MSAILKVIFLGIIGAQGSELDENLKWYNLVKHLVLTLKRCKCRKILNDKAPKHTGFSVL